MKSLILLFLLIFPNIAFLQNTCTNASILTATGTYTSGVLNGNGASQPSASAARWYKFTPSTNGMLQISSCGGGSDTRLWIWSGTCGNLQAVANNDDFAGCISTGASEFASRIQNLILLAGNTYYFEWDNFWENTSFSWSFTFAALPNNNDVGIVSVLNPYTRIPISQAVNGIQLGARIKNYSSSSLTSVALQVEIYELPNLSSPIVTYTSNPQTLGVGSELDFVAGTWSPVLSLSKTYQIKYIKTQPQLDAVGTNDQQVQTLVLDYNSLARDNGTYNTAFNWSTTSDYVQATRFNLTGNDNLTGFRYFLQSSSTNQNYRIQLYNSLGGQIDTSPFWESPVLTSTGTGWQTYNLPNAMLLTTGTYVMGIYKSGTLPFPVGCANSEFRNQASYIRVGSGTWNPIESYSLPYVFMLRPKFGPDPAIDIAVIDHQNPGGQYTNISTRQQPNGTPLNFSLRVQNNGVNTASSVVLQISVKNAAQQVVYAASSAQYTLLPFQLDTLEVPSFLITQVGKYTIDYTVLCPGDIQLINNSISTLFERSTNQLAKHAGVGGAVGIGNNITSAYDNGIIGQCFQLQFADVLDSVRFVLRPGTPANQPVRVEIYACNAQGIPVGNVLAQSINFTTTTAHTINGVTLSLPLSTGALSLSAGTYFIGITEQAGSLQLGSSAFYYQPNNTFRRWNQNPFGASTWSALEQFNQFVSLAITPIFKPCLPLTLNAQVQQASCGQNNGSISFSPTGFSGQITYQWNPVGQNSASLGNLSPGLYTCQVFDENNCSLNYNTSISLISSSPQLNLDSVHHVNCFGGNNGALYWSVNGGLSPYVTQISSLSILGPSFTNLMAGSYTTTLTDANNCIVQQTVQITEPTILQLASQEIQSNLCFGDSSSTWLLNTNGGMAPYSIWWPSLMEDSLVQSNLPAGNYAAELTDANGCQTTLSISVSQPPLVQLNVLSLINSTCAGLNNGSVSVLASGGFGNLSYFWPNLGLSNQQLTNLGPGSFDVHVQDQNLCQDSLTVVITEPDTLHLQILNAQNPTCFGQTNGAITVLGVGGTAPYSYQWTTIQSSQSLLQSIPSGVYTCIVSDINSCQAQVSHTLLDPTSLQIGLQSSQPTFCGQANGSLSVDYSGGTGQIQAIWNNNQIGPNLINVIAGSYQLSISDSVGCSLTQSFIVPNIDGPQLSMSNQIIPTCHDTQDGQLSVAVQDTSAIQSVVWSPSPNVGQGSLSISNVGNGTYVCTVTDTNACVANLILPLVAPTELELNVQNIGAVSCNGGSNGSVTVLASGGTAPYVYNWPSISSSTTTQTGLMSGMQLCVVNDLNNCSDSMNIYISEPSPLVAQVQVLQSPSCIYSLNGVLQAQAQGGTLPYSYQWLGNQQTSPTLIGVGIVPQTLVVTDALFCIDTLLFIPTSLSQIETVPQISSVTCEGFDDGQIVLTITGGQSPYNISWNTGATGDQLLNLSSGLYHAFILDSLGCQDTLDISLQPLSMLNASVTGTSLICTGSSNGELLVNAQDGILPYQLALNGQIQSSLNSSNLSAGSYQLLVSDSLGCVDSLSFQIDSSNFTINALVFPTLCQGVESGSVYLTAQNGIAPYFYSWQGFLENADSLLGLPTGYIHYIVSDAMNCSIEDSVFIDVSQTIQVDLTMSPEVFGQDGEINLTPSGTFDPYFYEWSNGAQSQDLMELSSGWYFVTVTDQNSCLAIDSIFVDSELSMVPLTSTINVYPNPFQDQILIEGQGITELILYDAIGAVVWKMNWTQYQEYDHVNFSYLSPGAYTLICIQNEQPIEYLLVKASSY